MKSIKEIIVRDNFGLCGMKINVRANAADIRSREGKESQVNSIRDMRTRSILIYLDERSNTRRDRTENGTGWMVVYLSAVKWT